MKGKLHFNPFHLRCLCQDTIKSGGDLIQLVGDNGVYFMAGVKFEDHRKDAGGNAWVCYADECHPSLDFDDWWEVKRETFGADDGVEGIPAKDALDIANECISADTQLRVSFYPDGIPVLHLD